MDRLQHLMSEYPAPILHLCNTHGQLLVVLCDVLTQSGPATLIYLDDEVPLDENRQALLRSRLPDLTLHVLRDANVIEEFANLPHFLPPTIRRNLRFWGTPYSWQPDKISGQSFEMANIYNTGFFTAKVAAGIAKSVTLRESGLNNYVGRSVTGVKRILRWLSGYPAGWQTMGEERWVSQIAVARPHALPPHVRNKGRKEDLQAKLAALNALQKDILLQALSPNPPILPTGQKNALLLTQPLELIGMCTREIKEGLYAEMVLQLQDAGFLVYVKNHPREKPFTMSETVQLDPISPIELWPLASTRRFDLAVALCSASLSHGTDALSEKAVQLISPDAFQRDQFQHWQDDIPALLAHVLAE